MYCYVSGMIICEGSCFSTVAIEVKLAYSYSVTCSNHQFCCNWNCYEFETIQHCGGTTTASLKTGPSGEALWELMKNWCFLPFSQQRCWKLCFSRPPKSCLKASFVATLSTECYRFGYRPLWVCWGFSVLARSLTSYCYHWPIQLLQCWAV